MAEPSAENRNLGVQGHSRSPENLGSKDLVLAKGDKLKQMIQISWVQSGSIILGGVAALSLLVPGPGLAGLARMN
eukprot:s4470_g1.t1